jgi:5-bromo-4-chloroindolyl phosphate hydrolysis protein
MGRFLLIFVVVFFGGLAIIIMPRFVAFAIILSIIAGIVGGILEIKYGKRGLMKKKEIKPKDEAIDDFEPV